MAQCDGTGKSAVMPTTIGDGTIGRCADCGQVIECYPTGEARPHGRTDVMRLFEC